MKRRRILGKAGMVALCLWVSLTVEGREEGTAASDTVKPVDMTAYYARQDSLQRAFVPKWSYRVTLRDKAGCGFSVRHPERFLSEAAIARRRRQGLKVDETDLPLSQRYLDGIAATGVRLGNRSKWNNSVVVTTEDTAVMEQVKALPYVRMVRKVAEYRKPRRQQDYEYRTQLTKIAFRRDADSVGVYGHGHDQIAQLNGIRLHERGFRGKGKTVAVIDAGYMNLDVIPAMQSCRILGTKDFVDPSQDIYATSSHGLMVLSCMGMDVEGLQIGTAPDAEYWLLRAEDSDTEQLVEEDNWMAAVEFADSVGADVINSSLGYVGFDNPADRVTYEQLNGHSHLISRMAGMVADKGMVLCNSAGNEGNKDWHRIMVPADADNILTVGAVSRDSVVTAFSSRGIEEYTLRVKPDVMARGGRASVMNEFGSIWKADGTSFSSPILCGMVASLWSALPELTAKQIIDLVKRSAHRYEAPDETYGYGIPDFWKAYELGKQL